MILPSPEGGTRQNVCQTPGSRQAGGRQGSVLHAVRCPAGGPEREVGPGRAGTEPSGTMTAPPAPSRAFPPPHVPAAPLASHCTKRPRAAGAPAAANQWETCCQAESSFEWPNQASQPEPLLIWGPGDAIANPPPRHLPRPLPPRSTAHSLHEAPPTLSAARRAREKRPSPGGQARGGESGEGRRGGAGRAPPPGALPAGGRAGSWSGKFQAGGRVSPVLPSHTAPQRRFSPPPDSSWRASQPVRAAPRACCGQRARLSSLDTAVAAAAPRRGAFGCPRRGRAAPFGDPRCAPAARRPRLSAHCSSGPSLSPPSSASRPSLLPPQVPPSSSPALV